MDKMKEKDIVEGYLFDVMTCVDEYIEAREGLQKITSQINAEGRWFGPETDEVYDAIEKLKKYSYEALKDDLKYEVLANIVRAKDEKLYPIS